MRTRTDKIESEKWVSRRDEEENFGGVRRKRRRGESGIESDGMGFEWEGLDCVTSELFHSCDCIVKGPHCSNRST